MDAILKVTILVLHLIVVHHSVQVMRRCQYTPHCHIVLTIGMLITGGVCMILLPCKSLQSADEISSNTLGDTNPT